MTVRWAYGPWLLACSLGAMSACSKVSDRAEVASTPPPAIEDTSVSPEALATLEATAAAEPDDVAPVAATDAAALPDVAQAAPLADVAPTVAVADVVLADTAVSAPDTGANVADAPALKSPLEPSASALPVPPIGIYATAEEAALVFLEGTRKRDPARLWSVMTVAARDMMDQVLKKAKAAADTELAKVGLKRDELDAMNGRMFFEHMVHHAPEPDAKDTVGAMRTQLGETPERATVVYTFGKSLCEAVAVKDAEGWKIEVSHCREQRQP